MAQDLRERVYAESESPRISEVVFPARFSRGHRLRVKFVLFDFRSKGKRIPGKHERQLAILVAKDYERRQNGLRPDRWHWADTMLLNDGWIVDTQEAIDSYRAHSRPALSIKR